MVSFNWHAKENISLELHSPISCEDTLAPCGSADNKAIDSDLQLRATEELLHIVAFFTANVLCVLERELNFTINSDMRKLKCFLMFAYDKSDSISSPMLRQCDALKSADDMPTSASFSATSLFLSISF